MKSSIEEIRSHFDGDVERFSNLETGQSTAMDSPLAMDLIARTAAATNPTAKNVLDIGCGAGNYTLKLLQFLPDLNVTLVDLSLPMLERATQRIHPLTTGAILTHQVDIRDLSLDAGSFDIIVAAAVLHHLRTDQEWENVFANCLSALKPGGSFWIFDLIEHDLPPIQNVMRQRYSEYLAHLHDETFRDRIFAIIEQEDTPRSLLFQLEMLHKVGFSSTEVLHKNGCFAAFGAVK